MHSNRHFIVLNSFIIRIDRSNVAIKALQIYKKSGIPSVTNFGLTPGDSAILSSFLRNPGHSHIYRLTDGALWRLRHASSLHSKYSFDVREMGHYCRQEAALRQQLRYYYRFRNYNSPTNSRLMEGTFLSCLRRKYRPKNHVR